MTGVRAAGPGLVHSSTSDPRSEKLGTSAAATAVLRGGSLVDRPLSRLRKMRHGILTAARLHGEGCVRHGMRYRAAMATLTYAPGSHWRGRHLSEYIHACRQYCKRAGVKTLRYAWVAEMQARGVIHYHVMFWLPYVMGRPFKLPKPDAGYWPHGMSEIAWARKAAGYLAKYTSKGQDVGDPAFPKGVRISGVGGLDLEGRREHRFWRAPSEAREYLGVGADIRRIAGGRVCALTGLFWESPWRLYLVGGAPYMVRIDLLQGATQ